VVIIYTVFENKGSECCRKLVSTETKKAEPFDPAFSLLWLYVDLFPKELLPPISRKPNQTRPKKEHGGGFGDGACRAYII
jgi:hypothetical protein